MNSENNELFRGKYRIPSARLPTWDYSSYGVYFITICTREMEECFGEIRNGIMGLNNVGCAATQYWREIPRHFPHASLDEWVVMPNHVHAVVWIRDNAFAFVETQNFASLPKWRANQFGPQSKNLGSIIRRFKIGVTKWCRTNGHPDFTWQPRFYDEIIRDDESLNKIRRYIRKNPIKWHLDRNNSRNFNS